MSLSPGTRLGHYDVTALLGEGGMGQVWQATDTQLNRQVALKILPDAFGADPDRLARFKREAQILASRNHPNIAQIHGIEEAERTRALVLELVEGADAGGSHQAGTDPGRRSPPHRHADRGSPRNGPRALAGLGGSWQPVATVWEDRQDA